MESGLKCADVHFLCFQKLVPAASVAGGHRNLGLCHADMDRREMMPGSMARASARNGNRSAERAFLFAVQQWPGPGDVGAVGSSAAAYRVRPHWIC